MTLYKTKDLLFLLKHLGVHPKKSLGQNFLINSQICQKINDEVLKEKADRVIEIGPGVGTLTERLKNVSDLILIEKDKVLAKYLKQKGFYVLDNDALLVDWAGLIKDHSVLVSNLPYQISSRLLIERSLDKKPFEKMILMFQKEVAQRILSQAYQVQTYGLLTVQAQTHWSIQKMLSAGPKDFYPSPQIGSCVLKFTPKILPDNFNSRNFLSFLKIGFSQRRKQLQKILLFHADTLKTNPLKIKKAFEILKIKDKARPEELSVQKWLDLFTCLNS